MYRPFLLSTGCQATFAADTLRTSVKETVYAYESRDVAVQPAMHLARNVVGLLGFTLVYVEYVTHVC